MSAKKFTRGTLLQASSQLSLQSWLVWTKYFVSKEFDPSPTYSIVTTCPFCSIIVARTSLASQTCYCSISCGLNPPVPLRRQCDKRITLLFSRTESRSLSELTRQITPPTKNGHAPPPTESRKSYQSVNPSSVRAWWDFPCWVKLSHRLHSWWCPSVNRFKYRFQIAKVPTFGVQVPTLTLPYWYSAKRNGWSKTIIVEVIWADGDCWVRFSPVSDAI